MSMKLLRYLGIGVAVLASLVGLGSASGAQGCTVTLQPGQSIQEALNGATEGAVICLAAGEWKESVSIEKSLTLRAAEVQPQPTVVIRSAKEGWPVILIRNEESIEVVLQGLKVTEAFGGCYKEEPEWICADGISIHGRARATILNTTISGNKWAGIWMLDSAQATIEHTTISGNRDDGIVMEDSAQATIQNNKIVNNKGYGVACYQRPCFDTDEKFEGAVRGSKNEISGNMKAEVCPTELEFLKTSAAGCYGQKC